MHLTTRSPLHCPRGTIPAAPPNAERARAFRDCLPVVTHNGYQWDYLKQAPEKKNDD
jgi:hypothetical protein